MNDDAPYPHAPVVLALVELRHPQAHLTPGEIAGIKAGLVRIAPLPRTETANQMDFQLGPQGALTTQSSSQLHRFVSRDWMTSVLFRPEGITIETFDYPGWPRFRELLRTVLSVRQDVAPIDGIQRIGLRYIDEIRVPGDGEPDWFQWVTGQLLPPQLDAGLNFVPRQQQCTVQYDLAAPNRTLTLRYGAASGSTTPIRSFAPRPALPTPEQSGSFFLLDTDAAWELPSDSALDEVDIDWVVRTTEELHGPSKSLFEAVILPKLRDEVLHRA